MCIMKEKTYEAKQKKMTTWANNHALPPNPTKDLKHAQRKSKGKFKGCQKRNGHPIFLKCSLETNLHPFLQTAQDGVHMTLPPIKKTPMSTSSGLGMKVDLNYSPYCFQ